MTFDNQSNYLVPSLFLQPLLDLCKQRYIDFNRLLAGANLPPSVLHDASQPIDCLAYIDLMNSCAAIAHDNAFGFSVGKLLGLHNSGIAGQLIAVQSRAVDVYPLIRYLFTIQNRAISHSRQLDGAKVRHKIDFLMDNSVNCDHIAQASIAGLYKVFREVWGEDCAPTRITFKYNTRLDTRPLEAFFRCPVKTGAEANIIEYPSHLLSLENPASTGLLPAQKQDIARALRECADLDRLVSDYIEFYLQDGGADKSCIASGMGIHPRVLQSCLTEKGFTFRQLLAEVRQRKACQLLNETDLSVAIIGQQLGYQESRVFVRAFSGWFGISPLQWRKRIRQ